MSALRIVLVLMLASVFTGCGYNTLQTQDEQVKSAWSEVLNQYQRRADLVPNLVNTVKGGVQAEKDILEQLVAPVNRCTDGLLARRQVKRPAA